MTPRPSLLLQVPSGRQSLMLDGLHQVVDIGRLAEAAGFGGVCVSDHVVLDEDVAAYPYGTFGHGADAPFLEPLAVLTAIGAVTTRLTLATHVLLAALRPATLLAKTVATVDRLSRGRLELGVGVGWHRAEFESQGLPFERRGDLLDSTMAACRRLWAGGPATFASPWVRFDGVHCAPSPERRGGPPVLYSGAMSRRNLRRIVDGGEGWIAPGATTVDEVAAGVRALEPAVAAAGRDPSTVKVRAGAPVVREGGAPHLGATLALVPSFVGAGATDVVVPLAAFVRRGDDVEAWFDAARTVLAEHGLDHN